MPPSKKRRESWDEEEEEVPAKKAKTSTEKGPKKDSDGNEYWDLAAKRRVVVSEYKSQTMVSIREYYEKDGNFLPGKKGISLPMAQFSVLVSLLPQIEDVLREKGEDLPRPRYDKAPASKENLTEDDDLALGEKSSKQNFEETSEDE